MDGFETARQQARLQNEYVDYLKGLKRRGFQPKVIYDIGACVCHFSDVARELWPNATIVLFDALPQVEKYYIESGFDHYHIGVLTNEDGRKVRYYPSDVHPGGSSYYREIGTPMSYVYFNENNAIDCVGKTLDTVVAERNFPLPDLIKFDVQGSEYDIISGGLSIVPHASVLLVEMQHTQYNEGAPLVSETLPYIESLGFKCVKERFCGSICDADYAFFNNDFKLPDDT